MGNNVTATKAINIRVTRDQHDRIRENAETRGFKNVSEFVRHRSLEDTLAFEMKFNRLYDRLMNEREKRDPHGTMQGYGKKPVYDTQGEGYHEYR